LAKVNLEVFGWIAAAFGKKQSGKIIIDEDVEDGATIAELLGQVAKRDLRFKNMVFTSEMTLQGNISIVLNGRILGQPVFLDARLKDGDKVMLLPTIDGG
jgi:molybdopterin converting factor small subunit